MTIVNYLQKASGVGKNSALASFVGILSVRLVATLPFRTSCVLQTICSLTVQAVNRTKLTENILVKYQPFRGGSVVPALDLVVRVACERIGDVGREVGSAVCTTSAGTYDTMLSSITLYQQEFSKKIQN